MQLLQYIDDHNEFLQFFSKGVLKNSMLMMKKPSPYKRIGAMRFDQVQSIFDRKIEELSLMLLSARRETRGSENISPCSKLWSSVAAAKSAIRKQDTRVFLLKLIRNIRSCDGRFKQFPSHMPPTYISALRII